MTNPPTGRHVQTDNTNHTLKRMGKKSKSPTTQITEFPQEQAYGTLVDIQQQKVSMATAIANRALDIRMNYISKPLGNVT